MNYATLFIIFYTIVFLWFAKSFVVGIIAQPEKILIFRFIPLTLAILIIFYLLAFNVLDGTVPNALKVFLPVMLAGIALNFIFNFTSKTYLVGNGYSDCASKLATEGAYGKKYDIGEKIGDNMWIALEKNGCP